MRKITLLSALPLSCRFSKTQNTYIIYINVLIHIHHKLSFRMHLKTKHKQMNKQPQHRSYSWEKQEIMAVKPWPALSSCPWLSPPLLHKTPAPAVTEAPHAGGALKETAQNTSCHAILMIFLAYAIWHMHLNTKRWHS